MNPAHDSRPEVWYIQRCGSTFKHEGKTVFDLKEFCRVQSLEQADGLLQEDNKNVILGGLLWMRMGSRQYHTGIDLSGLGLDRIEDKGDRIDIGAMACLRQLETSAHLTDNFGPLIRDAVSSIVGVQFRNLATVGGTVFSRFSFSDLITALLVLDTRVHLHRGAWFPWPIFWNPLRAGTYWSASPFPSRRLKPAIRVSARPPRTFPFWPQRWPVTKPGGKSPWAPGRPGQGWPLKRQNCCLQRPAPDRLTPPAPPLSGSWGLAATSGAVKPIGNSWQRF